MFWGRNHQTRTSKRLPPVDRPHSRWSSSSHLETVCYYFCLLFCPWIVAIYKLCAWESVAATGVKKNVAQLSHEPKSKTCPLHRLPVTVVSSNGGLCHLPVNLGSATKRQQSSNWFIEKQTNNLSTYNALTDARWVAVFFPTKKRSFLEIWITSA